MIADPHARYDLAVIGAGSAGFSAAIAAAELGARVALIGHGTIGGTCVNTGCVPSKNLIRATEALHQAKAAARFGGIRAQGCVEDWRAVIRRKDELVSSLRRAKYIDLLPNYDTVAYFEGQARLTEGGVVVDGRLIDAGKVIVATGSSPSLPPIPGIASVPYLTSTTALDLERLPKSLLVIGGGSVGCELGQMLVRAGVAVTIVDILPILSAGEPEISQALADYLREERIVVREGVETTATRRTAQGVALEISADGREETLAAENALDSDRKRYDATVMPAIVFTDPQVASVGLTETEAKRQGLRVRTSMLPLDQVPRALAARDARGLIKLVAEADSGRLLGAHILAPEGAGSIQTAALAIKCGLTVEQLADTIFPYPTTVEGLKLAAQAFDKDVAKLSCCAG